MLHPLQRFPSSPRSDPDIVSDIWAGSPRSLALCQVVLELFLAALEIILDPVPGFSSRLFLVERMMVTWCSVLGLSHLNKFVLHSPFIIVPVASVLLSIPSVCRLECFILALQDSWTLLVVLAGYGSRPVRGPVLWTVNCLGSSPVLQGSLHGFRPTRFHFSGT